MSNSAAPHQRSLGYTISLVFGFILLAVLAFFPLSLNQQTNYHDIILNSLHLPGVWFFYFLCRQCLARNTTILCVVFSLFFVEIVQHMIGREASWFDIFNGFAGLYLGMQTQRLKIILVIGCWLIFFTVLIFLRYETGSLYPNFGQFAKTSMRHHWQPLQPESQVTSALLFIKKPASDTDTAQHLATNSVFASVFGRVSRVQDGYFGASFSLRKNKRALHFSHLELCIRTASADKLRVRIDDRPEPTYRERINLTVPATHQLHCHLISLTAEVNKMSERGFNFKIENARNIAVFLPPEAQSQWFEIHSLRFKNAQE